MTPVIYAKPATERKAQPDAIEQKNGLAEGLPLPDLSHSPSSETAARAATGTDGRHIKKLRAQHLPTGGDVLGRLLAI